MEIEIKNTVTLKDYLQFNKWYSRKTPFYYLCLLVILFILSNLIIGDISKSRIVQDIIFYCILYILMIIATNILIYWKTKHNYESDKSMKIERIINISKEKIIEQTEYSSTEFKWNAIDKVIEYKGHIYIMLAKNKGLIIQKDKVSDDLRILLKEVME